MLREEKPRRDDAQSSIFLRPDLPKSTPLFAFKQRKPGLSSSGGQESAGLAVRGEKGFDYLAGNYRSHRGAHRRSPQSGVPSCSSIIPLNFLLVQSALRHHVDNIQSIEEGFDDNCDAKNEGSKAVPRYIIAQSKQIPSGVQLQRLEIRCQLFAFGNLKAYSLDGGRSFPWPFT
ncbi:hypothetical protein M413DRAFT_14863 [Hebeloma cylindrosporum]|uniref:Uncharacterized protein n=1 Tax=Hebeloma cylindrosporum TaxID=76867 RepID=A0A0C2Y182_HEBCY|nr:hypothetical protein M413DRAFT_14888 [Hebeloma cylindrosporum h7]KIM34857.1 hypothetical protein M413DRAFT_14863 [Hebeloma cylindrosporum h7]